MRQTVDKQAIARAFGRAARCYNHYAELQRRSGEQLAFYARRQTGQKVLDAGCGSGWFSQRWRRAGNHVTALDLSAEMLMQARSQHCADHYEIGDIEALPFTEPRFDLCWSNLAVQWCSDLSLAMTELRRVTLPGGQVLFSTLAAGSLNELHSAWHALDLPAPVNRFLSVESINEAGQSLRAQLYPQTLTLGFPDVLSALRSLKGIGATHLHQGRSGTVLSRRQLQHLALYWPRDSRGFLLSYHLVYGVIDCE
ncbi:malonyl-[acyl-carrier protein] O-methyltransferase BioC [Erwinia endophytica]|uniref:malonyl-ACP O-methyltransferase BioC n=1 Tax=Erwinia endophytica TaxID=1563158 RepID=UPI001265EE24|nr:malonyl-ACP O-methyltransferase BioC [Erwinia endophytica]KAB8313078.1 malonyl-[acyl-carrier protein] O-methyltransferase BioC [Erwinia endophytica]